eukprot:1781018-Prymnesium_polylepis.2
MQGGGEVQAGPSGTATSACGGVRVGDVRFFLLLPDRAHRMWHEKKTATLRVAPYCGNRSNGPGIVHATLC